MTSRPLELPGAAARELVIRLHPGQFALLWLLSLLAALAYGYTATERTVRISLPATTLELRTHQRTLGEALAEAGYRLTVADIIVPPLDTPLESVTDARLWLAQPVEVEADGQTWQLLTQVGGVADVLQTLDIRLGPADRLRAAGADLSPRSMLAALQDAPLDPLSDRPPVRFSVLRALPVRVSDDGVAQTLYTFAPTVGALLRANDVRLHASDRIAPAPDEPLSAGMLVRIERAKPLTILADGKQVAAHTREPLLARALAEAGIRLGEKDYTDPPGTARVQDNMTVRVVRVREDLLEAPSPIPFARLMQGDNALEIDRQELRQRGVLGEHRKLIRVRYEDGQEVKRTVEREWDARAPVPQITAYGRKLVVRELETPQGVVQYWRVTRMYATSYSPARSGTSPDRPWYGRTSAGLTAGKGIVAIDKSVVPWLSRLYIPGYGVGIAGDTGKGVRGRWVDLGFGDDNYESWYRWVDVYWLTPLPDPATILWIMPSYPVEQTARR